MAIPKKRPAEASYPRRLTDDGSFLMLTGRRCAADRQRIALNYHRDGYDRPVIWIDGDDQDWTG